MSNDQNLASLGDDSKVQTGITNDVDQSGSAGNSSSSNKDPLAVLEELLAKQKASGAKAGGGGGAAAQPSPTPEEETAKRREEYERLKAEAAARDQALLDQQTQQFEALKATPQYQARVAQQKEAQSDLESKIASQDGFEIFQLETTKIDT